MNNNDQIYRLHSSKSIGKPSHQPPNINRKIHLTPKKPIHIGNTSQTNTNHLEHYQPKTLHSETLMTNGSSPITERQYHNSLLNYEMRLRQAKEEHQKTKQQMEEKIYSLQVERNQLKMTIKKLNEDRTERQRRLSGDGNMREPQIKIDTVQKLRKQNNTLAIQKDQAYVLLNNIKIQNQYLQHQINNLNRQIQHLQPQTNRRSKSPKPQSRHHSHSHSHSHHHHHHHHSDNSHHKNQPSNQANSGKELEKLKAECEQLKKTIQEINEQQMRMKLGELNRRYSGQFVPQVHFRKHH